MYAPGESGPSYAISMSLTLRNDNFPYRISWQRMWQGTKKVLHPLQSACGFYMSYGHSCVTLSSFSQLGLEGHTSTVETDHQGTGKTSIGKTNWDTDLPSPKPFWTGRSVLVPWCHILEVAYSRGGGRSDRGGDEGLLQTSCEERPKSMKETVSDSTAWSNEGQTRSQIYQFIRFHVNFWVYLPFIYYTQSFCRVMFKCSLLIFVGFTV